MIFHELMFYLLAAILLVAGIRVITVKNPVHAALHLVLAFVAMAGLWLMLQAEFLGLVLVLVYVGAVMVLFLFVVMMIDISTATIREGFTRYAPLGAIIAAVVAAEIGYVVLSQHTGIAVAGTPVSHPANYSNTQALGMVLYTQYAYPFELASAILLVGIVAAIALTMRRRPGTRHQDIDAQVRVRREDRVRLVSMAAVPRRETKTTAHEPEAVE
ncbi:MAG TPA: NADH-quinone oxidoreductase subunit J [Gammaproteobacteria bacterium]|jgi:NADH-quinone oxidoreductase subunit J|nr:NADH-quinone oxidoreductase subunit J [Gammaproteobacteria bacterium]